MTEAEWLTSNDPQPMLQHVRRKTSDRKLRLFASACCRRGRSLLRSKTAKGALESLEAYADGLITRTVMEQRRTAWYGRYDYPFPIRGTWASALATATISHTKVWANEAAENAVQAARKPDAERAFQSRLLREIVGNPFRTIAADVIVRSATAITLAQQMYDARDFGLMPMLADALEDAGCTDPDILSHCRGPGPHVRGCWVVDLVLGNE